MIHKIKIRLVLIYFLFLITTTVINAQDQFVINDQFDNQNVDIGELLSLVERPQDIEPFLANFYPNPPTDDYKLNNLYVPSSMNKASEQNEQNAVASDFLNTDYQNLGDLINENDLLNAFSNDLYQNLANINAPNEFDQNPISVDYANSGISWPPMEDLTEPVYFRLPEPVLDSENVQVNLSFENSTRPDIRGSINSTKFSNMPKNSSKTTATAHNTKLNLNTTIFNTSRTQNAVQRSKINSTIAILNITTKHFNSNATNKSLTTNKTTTSTVSTTSSQSKNNSLFLNDLSKSKHTNNNGNLKGQKPSLIGKGGHLVEKRVHMEPMSKSLSAKEDLEQFHHHHHYHNYTQTFNYYQLLWIGTTIFFIAIIVIAILVCPKMNKDS